MHPYLFFISTFLLPCTIRFRVSKLSSKLLRPVDSTESFRRVFLDVEAFPCRLNEDVDASCCQHVRLLKCVISDVKTSFCSCSNSDLDEEDSVSVNCRYTMQLIVLLQLVEFAAKFTRITLEKIRKKCFFFSATLTTIFSLKCC